MLPDAQHWHETPDGPDIDQEAPDALYHMLHDMADRIERLEDEVARLRG